MKPLLEIDEILPAEPGGDEMPIGTKRAKSGQKKVFKKTDGGKSAELDQAARDLYGGRKEMTPGLGGGIRPGEEGKE
jgi:hypothetical protein